MNRIMSLRILTEEQEKERRQSWDRLFAKHSNDKCLKSRKRKSVYMPKTKNIAKKKSKCKTSNDGDILKYHPRRGRPPTNANGMRTEVDDQSIVNDIDNASTSKSHSTICSENKYIEYEIKDQLKDEFTPDPYTDSHCIKKIPKQGGQRQRNPINRKIGKESNMKIGNEDEVISRKQEVSNNNLNNDIKIVERRNCKNKLKLQNDSKSVLKTSSCKTIETRVPKKQKPLQVEPNKMHLVYSSCKKEIMSHYPELVVNSLSKNVPLKTNSRKDKYFNKDQDESEIKNLIENKLKSDLAYKVFKRHYSQVMLNTDKESFLFWDNAVKAELQKLTNIISLDKLSQYMLSSLTQKITDFNNETMASRNA